MANRELKFRVFDPDAEFMVYSESHEGDYLFGFEDGKFKAWVQVTIYDSGSLGDPPEPPEPGVEELDDVMQFTGLKDKNGLTDVYEGDIIGVDGLVKGNCHENPSLLETKANLLIPPITSKDWAEAYKEAMERGCKHAE